MTPLTGKMLVVDDDFMNRKLLARSLEKEGHAVVMAEGGRQALALLEESLGKNQQVFDLVFLDLLMPEMDGFEVLKKLKADERLRHLPIIMVSAMDDMNSIIQCISLGATDYLPKPFDPILLKARVSSSLLVKQTLDQEKLYTQALERDLEIGRQIQSGFFPDTLPQVLDFEISAHFEAARQVAGDFYDVFPLADEMRVGLVVADVCDKGVGAALFMALFRSLLRAFAEQHYDQEAQGSTSNTGVFVPMEMSTMVMKRSVGVTALKKAIVLTNNYIAKHHSAANMFATIFFGVLDVVRATLYYINAGHEAPLLVRKNGTIEQLNPTGPAAGLFPDLDFEIGQVRLREGDMLVGFTDGVTEAKAANGDFFGDDRLRALLAEPAESAEETLAKIVNAVKAFTNGAEQSDDITLLAVRRKGL